MPRQYQSSYDSQYTASNSQPPDSDEVGGRWQTSLMEFCKHQKYQPPAFSLCSERRGGRTAWSSKVLVQGHEIAARYFYDGDHVNNAREDAAERALIFLSPKAHQAIATTKYEGQLYPHEH